MNTASPTLADVVARANREHREQDYTKGVLPPDRILMSWLSRRFVAVAEEMGVPPDRNSVQIIEGGCGVFEMSIKTPISQ